MLTVLLVALVVILLAGGFVGSVIIINEFGIFGFLATQGLWEVVGCIIAAILEGMNG